MAEVPPDLREEVVALRTEKTEQQRIADGLQAKRKETRDLVSEAMAPGKGPRAYLFSLGIRTTKEHSRLHREAKQVDRDFVDARKKAEAANQKLRAKVTEYLEQHDPKYAQIKKDLEELKLIKGRVAQFMELVTIALQEVNGAEAAEAADLSPGSHRGFAIFSALKNAGADFALGNVSEALPAFRQFLNAQRGITGTVDGLEFRASIRDEVDTAIDLIGGIDITSIGTIRQIRAAESKLLALQDKLTPVVEKVEEQYTKKEDELEAYIEEFIQAA